MLGESEVWQADSVDKEVLSVSNHLLKQASLVCFQVLFPFKPKYLKSYAANNLSVICANMGALSFFNSLPIELALKSFYRLTNLIIIDTDSKSRKAAIHLIQLLSKGEPTQ